MLGILVKWDVGSECQDYTDKHLLLMLCKLGLDTLVLYSYCRRLYTCFLSMCSLSILLADLVMVLFIASMWFLGPERNHVSLCLFLTHASVTFEAVMLPMMCLGLFDYFLDDTYLNNQSAFCKFLRNVVLTVLVWMLAVTYSFTFAKPNIMELGDELGNSALVCELKESTVIMYFIWGVFLAEVWTMLPFWPQIPQWVKEAWRLEEREEQESRTSDFTSTICMDAKSDKEYYLEETIQRPPLWLSLTLSFSIFWLPYLTMSVACMIFELRASAFITVNLLWLECANSLLMGMAFWVKSKKRGPYCRPPENVCSWRIFWKLSKERQQALPIAVFDPSKGRRNTLLYV